mmetsp:Transcript_2261/g.3417  ORF Transcript_2261/g.3417 Transcript_2261/m.3417 type:complete len:194 (+) Transcript_2261:21-602(+)
MDSQPSKAKKVIIIGAGLSGVKLAHKLISKQKTHLRDRVEYVILEANNYIGGRIHATDFCGTKVEEGANWVYGTEHQMVNPIYKHALRCKLHGKKEHHSSYCVRDCSRPDLCPHDAKEEYDKAFMRLDRVARKLKRNFEKNPIEAATDIPVRDALDQNGYTRAVAPIPKLTEWMAFNRKYSGSLDRLSAYHNV